MCLVYIAHGSFANRRAIDEGITVRDDRGRCSLRGRGLVPRIDHRGGEFFARRRDRLARGRRQRLGIGRFRRFALPLELDDRLSAAHTAQGWILRHYDWDFAGARRCFERAIALSQ